jgi:hypothetical protein
MINARFSTPPFFLQLFGYFQSNTDDEEIVVGEEVNVFTVSKRRRVGEAAGKMIHYTPSQG